MMWTAVIALGKKIAQLYCAALKSNKSGEHARFKFSARITIVRGMKLQFAPERDFSGILHSRAILGIIYEFSPELL